MIAGDPAWRLQTLPGVLTRPLPAFPLPALRIFFLRARYALYRLQDRLIRGIAGAVGRGQQPERPTGRQKPDREYGQDVENGEKHGAHGPSGGDAHPLSPGLSG